MSRASRRSARPNACPRTTSRRSWEERCRRSTNGSAAVLIGRVSLIYERLRWGCARGELVLRFGREIAGVMSFVQLFFKRPADAIDHPPALNRRTLADFFRPAGQVFIFLRLQELARVVVGGAIHHPV